MTNFRIFLVGLIAFFSLASVPATASCPGTSPSENQLLVMGDQVSLLIEPHPEGQRVGDLFAIDIHACGNDLRITKIEAVMPAHGHGMNYRTRIQKLDDHLFHVKGLMFHMAGLWRLDIEVKTGEERQELQQEILIKP